MSKFESIVDDIVENEIRLKTMYKYSKSDEYKNLVDEEKILIEKQAKVMDELTSVLKARLKYIAKTEE